MRRTISEATLPLRTASPERKKKSGMHNLAQRPTRGCVSPAVTPRTASIAFAAPCAPRRNPGVVARVCSSVEIRLTLSPSWRADGNLRRRGGLRLLLLVSLPREVRRIRQMRESPPSWPNAPPCLWLRWCIHPSLPLMTEPPPSCCRPCWRGDCQCHWGRFGQ
jgi:hypothetical protein